MKNSLTIAKHVMIAAVALTLGACSNTFKSDVATFHKLPTAGGEHVSIMPMDPSKQDSLEYQQYAAVLGNFLRLQGYQQAGDSKPDLIVGFNITFSDGREKLENRLSPGFRGGFNDFYWRGYWHHGYFWGPPVGGFWGPQNELYARTVYHATLEMEVRKPDGELLFEGRAETDARKNSIPEVMPLLAEALFENFPGPSGVTRHVKIDLDEKGTGR